MVRIYHECLIMKIKSRELGLGFQELSYQKVGSPVLDLLSTTSAFLRPSCLLWLRFDRHCHFAEMEKIANLYGFVYARIYYQAFLILISL